VAATRAQVVAFARGEVGTSEQPAGSNHQKYGRWFGWDGVPWCGIFDSYVYAHAGLPLPAIQTDKGFASVAVCHEFYADLGLFRPAGEGQPGDLVIYTFSHVGILDHAVPSKNQLVAVEGNTDASGSRTGGQVLTKERHCSLVKGICKVQGFASDLAPAPKFGPPWPGRYLALTTPLTKGADVKELQRQLRRLGAAQLAVDGVYGPHTDRLVRWWQHALAIHERPGVVGPATWTALHRRQAG
jgi:hypothetical protein